MNRKSRATAWSSLRVLAEAVAKLFRSGALTPTSGSGAGAGEPERTTLPANIYEAVYEAHGEFYSDDQVVGDGDFDLIGRIELGVLLMEGLRPTDTLMDLGCGTGRLAVKVIPTLVGGHYIGTDISQSMLDKARARLARATPEAPCRVDLLKQIETTFPIADRTVDMICAFSVFTHIEHEDTYRYLKDGLRIIRPGGHFIFSCLPMSLPVAREIFLQSAQEDFRGRWKQVRNVMTSIDFMDEIARLAGWNIIRWYSGDERNVRLPDTGELAALGQSICVLSAPVMMHSHAKAEEQRRRDFGDVEVLGRIELCWNDSSIAFMPRWTGPLLGDSGRFHLLGTPGVTAGSLSAPPFATVVSDPRARIATISVSRLVDGVYRYSVEISRAVTDIADLFLRVGATVKVHRRDQADPIVFVSPSGTGRRWTVFDVVVSGGSVSIRKVNRFEAVAEEDDLTENPFLREQ